MPSSLVVIGAGVTGLTTASLLQSNFPNTPIIIIAAETPDDPSPSADYASMWAGAHYRPVYPLNTAQTQFEHELALRTAETMRCIAREVPEAGVAEVPGVEYFDKPPKEMLELKTGDTYAWSGDGFRVMRQEELPNGAAWGCEYQSYCVNISVYCRWLMSCLQKKGAKIVRQRLSSASEAFDAVEAMGLAQPRVVVNCSGRNFDQDGKVKIIRGQTVLVRQQHHSTVTWQKADGTWVFLVPRPLGGGTIVGGTKEVGDWHESPRSETKKRLLQNCVEAFPDFVDNVDKFEVLQENVGRRPWREGGYRIDTEVVGPDRSVIHGYGAGGRGYELSWGAAGRIVDLVKTVSAKNSKL
jgi:D-amino-acid oxidase